MYNPELGFDLVESFTVPPAESLYRFMVEVQGEMTRDVIGTCSSMDRALLLTSGLKRLAGCQYVRIEDRLTNQLFYILPY